MSYHNTAFADNTGLPIGSKYLSPPSGLTTGGSAIYRRARLSVPLCNALAELAGIAPEVAK